MIRRWGRISGWLGLTLMPFLLGSAGGQETVYPKDDGALNIVVAADTVGDLDKKVVLSGFNLLAEILAEKWAGPYSVNIVDTYAQARDQMASGAANVSYISTIDFLQSRKDGGLNPRLITVYGGGEVGRYVLLLPADSTRTPDAESMRGLSIRCYVRGDQRLMRLWVKDELGENLEACFQSVQFMDKPSACVLATFFGQVDACIVPRASFDTACELNPQLQRKLRVCLESPPLPANLFCTRIPYEGVDEELLTDVALKLDTYPKGRQIFALTRIQHLAEFDEIAIEDARMLLRRQGLLPSAEEKP